jgi:hypothetical protein
MEIRTYQCDNCGKLQGSDETWWIVSSTHSESFVVFPWGRHVLNNGHKTVCSNSCIMQLLSEFLSEKVEKVSIRQGVHVH